MLGYTRALVFIPLLFIVVLEALSLEYRTGYPWELFYVDNLVIIAESFEGLCQKLAAGKINLENTGLRIKMKYAKVMLDFNMESIWTSMWCQYGLFE